MFSAGDYLLSNISTPNLQHPQKYTHRLQTPQESSRKAPITVSLDLEKQVPSDRFNLGCETAAGVKVLEIDSNLYCLVLDL